MLEKNTFLGGDKVRNAALATATAVGLFFATTVSASAWVIDFEGLTQTAGMITDPTDIPADTSLGLIIDNEYQTSSAFNGQDAVNAGLTATFSAFVPGTIDPATWTTPRQAVLFDSRGPVVGNPNDPSVVSGGDTDLVAPFTNVNQPGLGSLNPGHILVLHEHPSDCGSVVCQDPDDEGDRPAGRHVIEFNQDIVLESIDFFDIEDPEGSPDGKEEYEIALFDSAGNQLDDNMFYAPETGGDNTWDQVNFGNLAGVRKIEVRMGGSGAIDNIRGRIAQVSEPAGLGLLAFGMVAMGTLRRRRRQG